MKHTRRVRVLAMLLLAAFLAGCGSSGQSAQAAEPAKTETGAVIAAKALDAPHSIVEKGFTTYVGSTEDAVLSEPFPLAFVDGVEDLPFVELRDWAELLYFVNTQLSNDSGYGLDVVIDDPIVTLERENGFRLRFDFENKWLIFNDYDGFVHNSNDSALIDLVSENGLDEEGNEQLIMRNKRDSFDRYGDELALDLGDNGIPMIAQDDRYYIPLQTLNDFTLLPSMISFIFNGEALFMARDGILFDYANGCYSEIADIYYSAPQGDRSDALAEYSYNELCLALDTFYGLKETHDIESFRLLFWQIGYDEVLSGNSAKDADDALKTFIDFYLDDLHSVFNEYSYLAGVHPIPNSTGASNRKMDENAALYGAAREAFYPDGPLSYEEVGNTAYITFDKFNSDYFGAAFYEAREKGEELDDTVALIIRCHELITRKNSPIENVVLDLSNNTGGAVDAAVVVLSWFLGDAPFSIKDMATGGLSTSVYRADINLDHVFDEKDTVVDKNLYCLISPVSFSCGNLVPAALKSSQRVTLLGRTSGGGSCVVQPMTTAYGTVFQISAAQRMSFLKNGAFYDIDQGVDPDYYIDNISNFYNRQALTDYINSLF